DGLGSGVGFAQKQAGGCLIGPGGFVGRSGAGGPCGAVPSCAATEGAELPALAEFDRLDGVIVVVFRFGGLGNVAPQADGLAAVVVFIAGVFCRAADDVSEGRQAAGGGIEAVRGLVAIGVLHVVHLAA